MINFLGATEIAEKPADRLGYCLDSDELGSAPGAIEALLALILDACCWSLRGHPRRYGIGGSFRGAGMG